MKKNILKTTLSLMLATSVLFGCAANGGVEVSKDDVATSAPAEKNDTFVYAIEADPGNNINIVYTSGRYDGMIEQQVYQTLFDYYSPDDITYYLAKDVTPNEDLTVYTANLRDDVYFHDGEKFTADDVLFSFKAMSSDPICQYYSALQFGGDGLLVEKVDDYTVTFTLKKPMPNFMEVIGYVYIAPEHIYGAVTDFSSNPDNIIPIGTGPYKYAEYKEGESTTLVKNENYAFGDPQIEKIVYQVIPDKNSAILSLQNGSVTALSIDATDIEKFNNSPVDIYPYSEGRVGGIFFNFRTKTNNEINNDLFRKAVFYGINKDELIEGVYVSEEYAEKAYSFLPSTATYQTDDVEKYEYDPEKSKQLLEESGVQNKNLVIAYPGSVTAYQNMAALVQDQLNQVGFNVELKAMDSSAFSQQLRDGTAEFDAYFNGYIMGIDPDTYGLLFMPDTQENPNPNFNGYNDTEVTRLFLEGIRESDETKRAEIYKELQQTIADNASFYPIAENKRIVAISNTIGGVEEARLKPVYGFEDMSHLFFK